jgi:hypothetical protein
MSLYKIFYMVMYYHIIYMRDFFDEFRQLFCVVVCTGFHEGCGFHLIRSLTIIC